MPLLFPSIFWLNVSFSRLPYSYTVALLETMQPINILLSLATLDSI